MDEIAVTRKYIWIFLMICMPLSNILWYIGYSLNMQDAQGGTGTPVIVLASFIPAFTALLICKVNKEGWDGLGILPNIRKSYKVYLLAVVLTWILVYMNDWLYLLIFKGNVTYLTNGGICGRLGDVMTFSGLGLLCSVELLGEEIGWLGFLFPKLEKLHGTNIAILLLSLIRTCWHLGILVFMAHPAAAAFNLFISNLLTQSFLIYLTKKSGSLFPAAAVHAITNLLPVFIVYSDEFYQTHMIAMDAAGMFSAVIVGGFCYILMRKENMIKKRV